MEIKAISLYPMKIPRKFPFKTSQIVQHAVQGILLEVEVNGLVGTGEAAPKEHLTGETLEQTLRELEEISTEILGKTPAAALDLLYCSNYGPAAKICLEMALLDTLGQEKGIPICDLLGKNNRERIEYCGFINSDEKGENLIKRVKNSISKGYSLFRIKVGELDFLEDYQRINTLRNFFGEAISLWLDVNQAWKMEEAVEYLTRLEKFNLLMVEQPLNRQDYKGHKFLKEHISIPLMLDESVQNEEDLKRVIKEKCADGVNLKFMKLGSFWEAKRLAEQASEAGLIVYCGASNVTDIFAMYGRHVEFALPELDYFSIGKPRRGCLVENPTEPEMTFSPRPPYANRPNQPGLGIKIKWRVLNKYLIKGLEGDN